MQSTKPSASLSLDLDNQWSYMKTHGDPGWESFPSYLDILVPRVLAFFKAHKLTITFFIVGQDAALERHRDVLKTVAAAGHEIGNHSFRHEPWLHLYSREEIRTELARAEEHIELATGYKPVGFRGPGYSMSRVLLQELIRRDYQYDASMFPSILAPAARAYYFATAKFTPEERQQRKILGGTLGDAFRPNKPYRWQMAESGTIVEIPVTTTPLFKVPIHLSYLLCLSLFSPTLARQYFSTALILCQMSGVQPSLLLHPTDFLGYDDTQDLSFFPAMKLGSEKKLELVSDFLHALSNRFAIRTVREHARKVVEESVLASIEPNFDRSLDLQSQLGNSSIDNEALNGK